MKLNFGREQATFPIAEGQARNILLVIALLAFCLAARSAMADVSLSGMARGLVPDNRETVRVPVLFRGYSSLGLRREAAAYLERKIRLAAISGEEAIPLFEEVVREQSRWDNPSELVEICETAIRNGAGTPLVRYSYGTGLRAAGRLAEASAIFAQTPKESDYFPYALFAIGQIAVEEGRLESAHGIFDRVLRIGRERKAPDFLMRRMTRSQAELLLILGRPGEAAPLFDSLLREGQDPVVRIGMAAADPRARAGTMGVSPEIVAGWPAREQILHSLLQGGFSVAQGRFADAVAHFNWAEEKIRSSLGSSNAPVTEPYDPYEPVERIRRLLEEHRSLRHLIADPASVADPEASRERIVELLVELLFIDHSIVRTQRTMPRMHGDFEIAYLSSAEVEEIIRMIEQVTLGGVEVDALVDKLAKKLDIFQNLAHPIDRYRLLTRMERSQAEIHEIKQRIQERRETAIAGVEAGAGVPIFRLLVDVGEFLVELDAIRGAVGELRGFTDRHFNILRPGEEKGGPARDEIGEMTRQALAIDRERSNVLLQAVKELEESARIVSWERKKREISALRPIVARQIIDALVGQARFFRARKTLEGRQEAWASLERAVSYLRGSALSSRDMVESALQIGSFLEEGEGRWELFPGRAAGEKEKEAIGSILPILDAAARSGELREEAAYLFVSLKTMADDAGARSAAKEYLREFSSSPLAGRIAVRMGHEALLAGRLADARALYRKAAESPEPAVAYDARYMVGWFRFQRGDAEGAAGELSRQLSDTGFRCDDPAPFEKAVLALAVLSWRESPLEGLASYPPVHDRSCGGRILLLFLGMDEERRGDAGRSALVYEVLAERFGDDNEALAYEKKAVDSLLRAGMEDQAFARILRLEEKYGAGTEWANSRTPPVREKAREEIAAMLQMISEKKFAEGVRSGEREAMAAAKTGMERFFAVREKKRAGDDAELRLKLAIASLKAGDRETGIGILKELAGQGNDPVGERAAILLAETRIAAYERKEDTGEDAEISAHLLLSRYPSAKATGLAYRAAAAFLSAEEYDRVKRMADEIEKNEATSKPILGNAQLLYAEAAIFTNDPASAREKADLVLRNPPEAVEPEVRERAKNLYVLASLKEIESRTEEKDWAGAGRMLEELGNRFPDDPEAPQYFLRAFRSYRMGEDREAAMKAGLLFLDKFPKRKEAVEIAGVVGAYLVEEREPIKAADLYEKVAERFPKSDEGPDLLFSAARLAAENGEPEEGARRFSAYRARYANPRWKSAYATLSIGLIERKRGDEKTAVRELERGIREIDAGLEKEAPRELWELGGRGRIVLGEYWAEQFRKLKLVPPLEKNLAIKERFFRRALSLFEKAKEESPTEIAIHASQVSGDLFLEFGKSILDSQRPKGLAGEERERFEEALRERARIFFEKALEWYVEALDRLETEQGPADLALSIRERIEGALGMLSEADVARGEK